MFKSDFCITSKEPVAFFQIFFVTLRIHFKSLSFCSTYVGKRLSKCTKYIPSFSLDRENTYQSCHVLVSILRATLVTALLRTSLCRIKYDTPKMYEQENERVVSYLTISCGPLRATALLWLPPSFGCRPLLAAALFWLRPSFGCRPLLAAALFWLPPSFGYGPLLAAALFWLPPSIGYSPLLATAL